MDLTQVENKVLNFTYNVGSTPGASRTILAGEVVTLVGKYSYLNGWDFDRKEFRNFRLCEMRDVETLPSQIVPYALLPSDLYMACQLYTNDGWTIFQDHDNERLVCYQPPNQTIAIAEQVTATKDSLFITTPKGGVTIELPGKLHQQFFAMKIYDAQGCIMLRQIDSPTAREVIDAITAIG